MKKLAILGALAALAWAQGVRAEDDVTKAKAEAQEKVQKADTKAQEETAEAKADAQKKTAEARKEAREEKAEAQEKVHEARKDELRQGTAAGAGTGSGAMAAGDERKHPMFEGKDNYEVKGKIESVTASSITVRREELPAAKLSVDRNTKIELDGEHVAASQLKQGQDVKASFNLRDDKPLAVEIKAEKAK